MPSTPRWAAGCSAPTCAFRDAVELRQTVVRLVGLCGRRIDDATPLVDARLPDGSRLNAVLPPLAVDGPLLTSAGSASGA